MSEHEKKTKVLFIITKSNWGGAQKYVYELATGLDGDMFEPVVVVGGKGDLASKLHLAHVRVIHLSTLGRDISPLRDIASFRSLLRIMRDERPDAVHLNSSKVGALGSVAARIAGVSRIIFTAHGWAFNEERPFISRCIIKLISFITILLSDVTIAVSNAVAKDSPAWGIRSKVVVIHLPTPPKEKLMDKKEAREYFANKISGLSDDGRLWVGIVAELHKNKGLDYAIKAMREGAIQKKVALIIVGAGQEEAVLKNQVRASDLGGSVFFAGFEPYAARLMPAFDIFLLPSITEAFGYVLLEAGYAEIPVIASRVGGIPEIIENDATGLLVPPRDVIAIRNALSRLMDSDGERRRLGGGLHARVSSEFSSTHVIPETARLYNKVL